MLQSPQAERPVVFLSYASQDAQAARRICDPLRAAGIEAWFDQSELRGGDTWDQKIRNSEPPRKWPDDSIVVPFCVRNFSCAHPLSEQSSLLGEAIILKALKPVTQAHFRVMTISVLRQIKDKKTRTLGRTLVVSPGIGSSFSNETTTFQIRRRSILFRKNRKCVIDALA